MGLRKHSQSKRRIDEIPVQVQNAEQSRQQSSKRVQDSTDNSTKHYHTLAITSGKGGVGKSTVTANIAYALSKQGFVVGVLDADIYGPSQSGLLGALDESLSVDDSGKIRPAKAHGIHFVSSAAIAQLKQAVLWRAPMANKLIMQFLSQVAWPKNMDILLFDLPPGTGDIHITLCQKAHIDGAFIVTTPQHVATQVAERGLQMLQKVNVPVWGVIENMGGLVCHACGSYNEIFSSNAAQQFADHYNLPMVANLPLETELCDASESGMPVLSYAPDSFSAACFQQCAQFISTKLSEQVQHSKYEYAINNGKLTMKIDGTEQSISARVLRLNCQCALCVDENTGKKRLIDTNVPENIAIVNVKPVGQYGLQLYFSDGHHTGIFQYKDLASYVG